MIPTGQNTKPSFTEGFFDVAAKQNPRPTTAAIVAADAEFARNACEGARENAKKNGFKIVYDRTYPPSTTDFTPIVRAIQATNPDVVNICSYPPDSVGMVRTVNEVGFKPKMIGGAMVGLQATAIKTQLGPLLNGFVNYETWVPSKQMLTPDVEAFLKEYQSRAGAEGVDPLGYYLGTWGYAYIELLGKAVEGGEEPRRQQDRRLSAHQPDQDDHGRRQIRQERRMGRVRNDAGAVSRTSKATTVDQFRGMDTQTVVHPPKLETGKSDLSVREGETVTTHPSSRRRAGRGAVLFSE